MTTVIKTNPETFVRARASSGFKSDEAFLPLHSMLYNISSNLQSRGALKGRRGDPE
jgi:hypothetical protein